MKKIFTLLVMSVFLFSFMSMAVLAQDSSQIATSAIAAGDVGLSDDDMAFATGDDDVEDSSGIWKDKARMWFTFDKEKKAKIKMRVAKKRMFEAGEKINKHPEKAKEIAKTYGEELDSALENFDEIVVDGDKEEVIKALKRAILIESKLEKHKTKVLEIHEKILEKKSDQMGEDQLAHLEKVFAEIEQKINESINHVVETQENLKARLIVLGLSEEEIDVAIEKYEAFLEKKKEQRQENLEHLREKIEERRAEILEDFGDEVQDISERILDAEEEIAKAETKINEREAEGVDVSEASVLIEEAKVLVEKAKTALDADRIFVASKLAKTAKHLASQADKSLGGDDDSEDFEDTEDDFDNGSSEPNDDGIIVLE